MGEIAEMMLEGVLCASCGEFLDEEGGGIPGYCSDECARACGATLRCEPIAAPAKREFRCRDCGRPFKSELSVSQHRRDKHGTGRLPGF